MPLSGFGSPHGPLWPPCKLRFLPSKPLGDGDDDDDDDDDEGGPTFSLPLNKLGVNLGAPKVLSFFKGKILECHTFVYNLFDGGAFMSSR